MNVFACLVHENPECVLDLVWNLRHLDPDSAVLLYDGGRARDILRSGLPFEAYGAVLFPEPMPQAWGRLHGFALDCLEFALKRWPVETVTIVDSDQLAVGAGYSAYLQRFLAGRDGVGMLGNSTEVIRDPGDIGPARCALQEVALWRPFLKRFPDGESKFPMWTFWPSSVFTAQAARALVEIFRNDGELKRLMARTEIFATEEIFLPTMTALLGFEVVASPCSYDYVKYRVPFTLRDVEHAIVRKDVFWMHSVQRELNDSLRLRIRERFLQYRGAQPLEPVLAATAQQSYAPAPPATVSVPEHLFAGIVFESQSIVRKMREVRGWLEDEEADLLIGTLSEALSSLQPGAAVVEVGSFEGKATVVLASVIKALQKGTKVYAVDPHDGRVGALDSGLQYYPKTYEALQRNLKQHAVADAVEVISRISVDVAWDQPLGFLLIDHLHDYASVARDFHHFEPWLLSGGYVAFHDYADYFPGVQRFVDELLATGEYSRIRCAKTMMVLRKSAEALRGSLTQMKEEAMAVNEEPLVSCLMPTANRRAFVPRAIQYFQRQGYRNRELIVVDDGEDSVADLIPDDPAIRYVRLEERVTIGEKHNLACSMARGEICLHWDDDDWMAEWRVAYQARELLKYPAMTLSGLARLYFYEPASDRAWEYCYGNRTPKWVSGATFCYRKKLWEGHPFPTMNEGGDTLYVWNLRGVNIVGLSDSAFYVATVHANNTSPKQTQSSGWRAISSQQIHALLDTESREFYRRIGREEAAAMETATHR